MVMPTINRQLRLQNRPKGLLAPGDLQPVEDPVAPLSDGQALARVKYLSIDPTMRVWMAADTYLFVSDTAFLGVLGINGLTAFFGMEIAQPKKGETLVVSATAGATGSIVGQIGEIHGCRVIGIAGTDEKCAWITKDLGFDAAINYKHPDWKEKLATATPKGIDIDFENVGGDIMQTVLGRMNLHGRVVLCGL